MGTLSGEKKLTDHCGVLACKHPGCKRYFASRVMGGHARWHPAHCPCRWTKARAVVGGFGEDFSEEVVLREPLAHLRI